MADAELAVAAAEETGRTLMVGHLLEYHPGVIRLKEIADGGELGEIHYIYSNRLNLGKLRADENALWSLGAHDVSVVLHLAGEEPYEVEARGESYMRPGIEDVVFAFLRFPSGLAAHLHLSWLDPHKERRFTVVGSRRMATFDDMDLERKVTVYDKGFDQSASSWGEYITRSGDIHSPAIPNREPLRLECEHFVACLRAGRPPRSDGALGAAGRARPGGAAGQPRRLPPGPACGRLTARPASSSAPTCGWARASGWEPMSSSTPAPWSATGSRSRITPCSASRPRWRATRRPAASPPARWCSAPGVVVCAGAVVLAGAEVGAGAILGDQSFVRERARIGERTVVGRGSCVDNDVVVGAACACRPAST